jgi:epoxyqueuosine reductase QueG
MDYIENCVVCLKYLPTKALQEQGMCNVIIKRMKLLEKLPKMKMVNFLLV